MPPSELRKEACEVLSGKWGKAVCIVLAYILITYALSIIGELVNYLSTFVAAFFEGFMKAGTISYIILNIAYNIIVSVPISFGLIISFMKLKRGEKVKILGFLEYGVANFKKSLGIWAHTLFKLLLPIVCVILVVILLVALNVANVLSGTNVLLNILSIVLYVATLVYVVSRALLYVLAYNISYDNSELSSKACVLKSEALMKGNRGSYFLLELSFMGWALLSVLTLGIGMLWLAPYIQVAAICFYEKVAKPEVKKIEEEVKIEE